MTKEKDKKIVELIRRNATLPLPTKEQKIELDREFEFNLLKSERVLNNWNLSDEELKEIIND